jgi:hypothetical protein
MVVGGVMKFARSLGIFATMLMIFQPAQARITRITIFEGRSFGNVGQYERLVRRVAGEIDPADPHNSVITDVRLAPRSTTPRNGAPATKVLLPNPGQDKPEGGQ